jgi:ribosome modulation factor
MSGRLHKLAPQAADDVVCESLQGWRDLPKPLASLAGQLGLFGPDEIAERNRAEAERKAMSRRDRLDRANGQGQLF